MAHGLLHDGFMTAGEREEAGTQTSSNEREVSVGEGESEMSVAGLFEDGRWRAGMAFYREIRLISSNDTLS